MLTDTILHKYMRHLRQMNGGGYTSMDAVELALRLALEELAESIPSTPSTSSTELAALQADLERLQTAADTEVAELRKQLDELDADNAAMIRRNRELTIELNRARQDAALDNTAAVINAQLNRRNTELAATHPNGDVPSTISNQQSPINNSIAFDLSSGLSAENVDWWIGIQSGRQQWRSIPKRNRLDLVRFILSHSNDHDNMTMATFDAIRPGWMPTAGTHTKVFNMTWEQLNDFTVDLEVTR